MADMKLMERPRCNGKGGDTILAAMAKIEAQEAKIKRLRKSLEEILNKLQGEINGMQVSEPIRYSVLISARDIAQQTINTQEGK